MLAECLPGVVFVLSPEGQIEYLNTWGFEYLGLTNDTFRRWTWPDSVHPDDLDSAMVSVTGALASGAPTVIECRIRGADGLYRWHLNRLSPHRDTEDGPIVAWFGTASDIDALKSAEARVSRTANLLSAMSNATTDAIFIKDLEGRYLYVNPACARTFGTTPDAVVGKTDFDFMPKERAAFLRVYDAQIIRGGSARTEEEDLFTNVGERRRFSTTKAPYVREDGTIGGVIGIARDITSETHAKLEAQRLAATSSSLPGVIFTFRRTLEGEVYIPFAIGRVREIFDSTAEDLARDGGIALRMIHPEDLSQVLRAIERSQQHLTDFQVECRLQNPSRGTIWVEIRSTPQQDIDGGVTWQGFCADISDRRVTESALHAERDRFAAIAATVPGIIYSFRRRYDGHISFPFVTGRIEDLFSQPAEELAKDATAAFGMINPSDMPEFLAKLEVSASTLTEFNGEARATHPKRGEIWVEARSMPMREPDGSILWHGFIADVTERKRAEVEQRAERDRLKNISETSPGVIVCYRRHADGSHSLPYANPRVVEIWGVSLEELDSNAPHIFRHVLEDDRPHALESFERCAATLEPWQVEFRVQHPTRGLIWVETHLRPTRESDGAVLFEGVVTDITAHKNAEARARSSEATLRSILEAAPDAIISVDRDFKVLFTNRGLPGTVPDRLVSNSIIDILPCNEQAFADRVLRKVFDTGEMQDVESQATLGGSTTWFQTRVGPVYSGDKVTAATICATDISERKRAEEALRASEERYRTLIDRLPDGIFVVRDGTITFCNPAFARLLDRPMEDIVGQPGFSFLDASSHQAAIENVRRMKETGEPTAPADRLLVRADGTRRRVQVLGMPLQDDEADGAHLIVCHDLSDMDRTQVLLGSVLESVTDAILTIDERGTVLTVNPALSKLFGFDASEIVNNNINLLLPAGDRRAHDAYLKRYDPEHPKLVGQSREFLGRRKDGTSFPIEVAVTSFQLDGKRHFTGIIRDITDRKRLEEQFRQAHKMEAFGQLAGGVAHDFNNVLTVILGEAELLLATMDSDDENTESLTDIYEAGQRAAALTRQLLAFSRKTVLEPKVLDINTIVRETEKMLRRLIGEDVALTTKLHQQLRQVHVDPGQLSQVVMNLAVNARDAMPRGGELHIETTNVSRALPADDPNATARDWVQLCVRDTGEGMTQEVRERVFQPFFTTKGVGKGTGLGLAVVHGIVNQSGGHIELISEPGVGTTFEIYLPAIDDKNKKSRNVSENPEATNGDETVLLVEDDSAVRRLATRALSTKGYSVLVARNGADAIQMLEQSGKVDLIVTDVVMPVMDGRRLGDFINARFPETRILYTSGYTDDMLVRRGLMSEQVTFLAKPYSPAALLGAVRALLDSAPPSEPSRGSPANDP